MSILVGREQEVAELGPLLLTRRLLTLVGPGGVGKTRLALELAHQLKDEFADGVCLVELAPVGDPALVAKAIATALGLVDEPSRPLTGQIADYLAPRETLLILDNCEHLIGACAELLQLLLTRCCTDLRVLATSREPVGVAGEVEWRVPALSLPPPEALAGAPGQLEQYEAVRLFLERARTVAPNYVLDQSNARAIGEVCRRLDGFPLAIELAAARIVVLSAGEIAERLNERFSMLTSRLRTVPARHQSLAAVTDWSYALLSEPERTLLRRLSVFAGGFALDAASSIVSDTGSDAPIVVGSSASLDMVSRLVDKSLVMVQKSREGTRYYLHETIRQYAAERLAEANEGVAVRDRHLSHYLRLAEQAEPQLRGAGILGWLERLETEHDNFRAALAWGLSRAENSEQSAAAVLQLAGSLAVFWRIRSHIGEGRKWLSAALALPLAATAPAEPRGRALLGAGTLAWLHGDYSAAQSLLEQSRDAWLQLGDAGRKGLSATLRMKGLTAAELDGGPAAKLFYEESLALARASGDRWQVAQALMVLGLRAVSAGDPAAKQLCDESLAIFREAGDLWSSARVVQNLARVAALAGDLPGARRLYEESLATDLTLGFTPGAADTLVEMGNVAQQMGDLDGAIDLYQQAIMLSEQTGLSVRVAEATHSLGLVELQREHGRAGGTSSQVSAGADTGARAPAVTQLQAVKARFGGLTARERQVAALIAQGKSNRDIAEQLVISERTADAHISNILSKLQFTSRTQVVAWAIAKGLAAPILD
jgi:predicted ATPase/DNA-binding CsgD family transcriptional regulator